MSGLRRLISGELAQSKSKGKKFLGEQLSKLSPKALAARNASATTKKKK